MKRNAGQTESSERTAWEDAFGHRNRRAFLGSCAAVGVVGVAGCTGGDDTSSSGDDGETTVSEFDPVLDGAWPVQQANLGNTGMGTGSAPVNDVAVQSVRENGLTAEPAFVDGVLYVNDRRIRAIESASGEILWQWGETATVENAVGTPAVVNGTVYFGSDEGTFYALDATSGEEQWSVGTEGEVNSSPAVSDGVVYFGDKNGTVYALDASAGDERWTVSTLSSSDGSLSGAHTPAISDGTVYVTSYPSVYAEEGNVVALDEDSGDEEWSVSTDAVIRNPPAIGGDVLFVSKQMSVLALDRGSGDELWTFDEPSNGLSTSPVITEELVYVGTQQARLFAIEAMNGDGSWQAEGEGEMGSIAVVDDAVYMCTGDEAGYVYGYDAGSGDLLWETTQDAEYDDGYFSGLCVGSGTIYTGKSILYAIEEA